MKNSTAYFLGLYQELEYNIELAIFKLLKKNKVKEDEVINIELANGSNYGISIHKNDNATEIRIHDIQNSNYIRVANQCDIRLLIDIFDILENKMPNILQKKQEKEWEETLEIANNHGWL